ncbi:hypothetical protein WI26_24125 [Burkholderia diffusa]|nr:hypothetical protein WI26_24125 [Burkholderia diffusa]
MSNDLAAGRLDRREIGEVERIGFDPCGGMEPANRIGGLRGARGIATAHHDGRALRGQRFRDVPAEAAVRAGHDGDLAALHRDVARAQCMSASIGVAVRHDA